MNYIIDQTKFFAAIEQATTNHVAVKDLISQIKTENTQPIDDSISVHEDNLGILFDASFNIYVQLQALLSNERVVENVTQMKDFFAKNSSATTVANCMAYLLGYNQKGITDIMVGLLTEN